MPIYRVEYDFGEADVIDAPSLETFKYYVLALKSEGRIIRRVWLECSEKIEETI